MRRNVIVGIVRCVSFCGTRNALFQFHAGVIEQSLGNVAGARDHLSRALAISPSFSLKWAPVARAVLEQLGGAR